MQCGLPDDNQTEWALKSTVAALTPDMIAQLHDLGFRRLHVGVQTLEDHRASRNRPAAAGRRGDN